MSVDPAARLWQFARVRGTPVKVERRYNTSIFTSSAGREQRRSRDDRPRKKISFNVSNADDCYRAINRELHIHQTDLYAVPDWTRFSATATVFAGAGNTVDVPVAQDWMVAGETVIVGLQDRFERYTIDTFLDPTLTFVENNSGASFPVGSRIYLAVPAYLPASMQAQRPLRNVLAQEIAFEVDPTQEFYVEPPAGSMFNGKEVLTLPPHRVEPIGHTFTTTLDTVDFRFGRKSQFRRTDFLSEAYAFVFTCAAADIIKLEQLFIRARGRRGEFYAPTWEHDIVPNVTAGSGITTLVAKGDLPYGGDTVFKNLVVHFTDDTFEYNTVTNITPGAGISTISVGTAWTRDIDPALVKRISWLPLCRFASDNMTTEWLNDTSGRIRATIQTLEDLA